MDPTGRSTCVLPSCETGSKQPYAPVGLVVRVLHRGDRHDLLGVVELLDALAEADVITERSAGGAGREVRRGRRRVLAAVSWFPRGAGGEPLRVVGRVGGPGRYRLHRRLPRPRRIPG